MQTRKTIHDIVRLLANHKPHFFSTYPLQSMAVFGSYARQEENAASDLDIVVEFKDNIGIRFVDLADELERVLGMKIDLVSRKGIQERYFHALQKDLIYV